MVEYDRTQDREHVTSSPAKICVVGIGGAGLNVLDRIALDRIVDATLIGMHTDVRVLSHTMTQHKLQLGTDLMRGIGSGGDPELGRSAAEDSCESIRSLVQGNDMVFICAGLGGGTGSGAVPVVARIAKECGALVFVFATTPFSFEGRRRIVQAELALEELQSNAEALILFENNRMGELVLPREGIQKAFSQADQLIGHSVRAITAVVKQPGLVRLGLSDLMSALRTPNARCLFGFGEARGTNRVAEALKKALKSPLIHQGDLLQHAQNLIVHVAGGDTLTLAEVEGLMKQLGKHIPDQTQILFGISVDPKLGDSLALTLLSSLSAQQLAAESVTSPAAKSVTKPAARPVAKPVTPPAPEPVVERVVEPAAQQVEEPIAEPVAEAIAEPVSEPVAEEIAEPVAEPVAEPLEDLTPRSRATIDPAPVMEHEELELPLANGSNGRVSSTREEELPEEAPEPVQARAATRQKAAPAQQPPLEPELAPIEAVQERPAPISRTPVPVAPPVEEEEPATLIKKSIFSMIEDEADAVEEEEETPLPASMVVPKPIAQPRVQAKPAHGMIFEAPAPKPEPALAAAGRQGSMQQPTLNLHQEEIARFKGTDKTIVEGEDLDVPTWMRMRQKVRR